MRDKEGGEHADPGLTPWERQLVVVISRKFELREPEELEAELGRTVLDVKARPSSGIRDWKNYLAKALHNKANNWVRDRRGRAHRETVLPESENESSTSFAKNEADPASQIAFAQLWRALSPELKKVWELLEEERGNLTQVARRLRVHRNTVRLWTIKIQQILRTHGYLAGRHAKPIHKIATTPRRNGFVVLHSRLLRQIARVCLNGTQWRILLWVVLETARRKQQTVLFRWSAIAKELCVDRGDVWRAGQYLRQKFVFVQNGRIGLRRNHAFGR